MLKELAILLFLIAPVVAGGNVTNTSVPSDYITIADLDDVIRAMKIVQDDSASVRRMLEVNARKLDELQARSWATSGEVQNLSMLYNSTMVQTKEDILSSMGDISNGIAVRMQTIKAEMYILVLVVLGFSVFIVNTVFGWKYKELIKHMGVFPKRTPMTKRERALDKQVSNLQKQVDNDKLERPKMSLWRLALSFMIGMGVLICFVIGVYFVLSSMGVF